MFRDSIVFVSPQHRLSRRWLSWVVCVGVWMGAALAYGAVDFAQQYERGKLLLKQKYFADAVKALEQAVMMTGRGKRHFGAHYYLAQSLWQMGDVARAKEIIGKARQLIKSNKRVWAVSKIQNRQRLLRRLERTIDQLFGAWKIIPEVDPETVGRLRIRVEPTTPLENRMKRRVLRYMDKQLRVKGLVLTGKEVYLPKGQYKISIVQPQCLEYGFVLGSTLMREILIGEQPASVAVKAQPSCRCTGGRVPKTEGRKKMCVCPGGTVWDETNKRCVQPKAVAGGGGKTPWIARNWPWITALGVGVVAAGVIIPVVLIESQNADREVLLQGSLFAKPK